MPITYDQAQQVLADFTAHDDPILRRLEEEAAREKFPIIGPVAGHMLYVVARTLRARAVFELGSGYGYSTLWFCRAVRENGGGVVHHTVWDERLHRRAVENVREAGYADLVRFHLGEAVRTLEGIDETFDLFFNDIDKEGYPASLPVIKKRLKVGGALLVDNMFLGGKIADPSADSPSRRGVKAILEAVRADRDFVSHILPMRDGVLYALRVR